MAFLKYDARYGKHAHLAGERLHVVAQFELNNDPWYVLDDGIYVFCMVAYSVELEQSDAFPIASLGVQSSC